MYIPSVFFFLQMYDERRMCFISPLRIVPLKLVRVGDPSPNVADRVLRERSCLPVDINSKTKWTKCKRYECERAVDVRPLTSRPANLLVSGTMMLPGVSQNIDHYYFT